MRELDAIRGIAAAFVMLHHFMLIFHKPWTADLSVWALLWHPVIGGDGRVPLFYLLSGVVLALPYLRGNQLPYKAYLVRRIVRIYCPYVAALVLSVVGAAVFHQHLGMGNYVDATWSEAVSWNQVEAHLVLVGNYQWAQFNTAFWSLVYEMRISLIFPWLFLLTNRLRFRFAIAFAGVLVLCGQFGEAVFSRDTFMTLEYAAVFVIGILLAKHLSALSMWYQKLSVVAKVCLLCGSLLLYGQAFRLHGSDAPVVWRLILALTVTGGAGLVVTALNSRRISLILRSAAPQSLGRIAFSLYLVHGTVLFTMLMLFRNTLSEGVFVSCYVVCSLGAALAFYHRVELPFAGLSRRVGIWVETFDQAELQPISVANNGL